MAKTSNKYAGGKVKTRMVGGVKGKRPELPVDAEPSNALADRNAQLIYMGLSAVAFLLVVGGLYWAATLIISAFKAGALQWVPLVAGILMVVAMTFVARSLAWLAYFASIMYAFKTHAWESMEKLCRSALKQWRIFPGGSSHAAVMLAQSLVSRGQLEEAIALGQQQWELHGSKPKAAESLAPVFSTLGMAYQAKGEPKEAIIWSERAIAAMERSLEEMVAKKTWQSKLAGPQSAELIKQLKMQLAFAYFNNATSYFNQMNHRQAKQLYKQALDCANQAGEFPQKSDIVKVSRDQLARLKHA